MRYIFNKTTVALVAASMLLTQCRKNILDVDPTIPISTLDDYYQSERNAINAVNAAYTPLSALYNGSAWHIGDIMSDDADLGGGGGGDGDETAELDNFNVNSFNPIINLMWAQCYFGILRSNLVVEKVPQIPVMSAEIRKRSIGEGKFLRALYYYHLVRVFGDVPLYTNVINVEQAANIARSPKALVYEQIINDLKAADTLLPAQYAGADLGRASSGAAKGILASVYLTLGDKTNAALVAKSVIDNRSEYGYDLWADYADNFNLDKENGKESVFEVQYRSGGGQWTDYGAGQKLNCFFAPRFQDIVQSRGYGWNVPTKDFADSYERTGDSYATITDKRRNRSMWIPGDTYETYTHPEQLVGSPIGLNIKKYFVSINNTLGDNGGWTCALNVPIMRYSEILLIYAEAAGPAVGKPYADQVRVRAGLDPLQSGMTDEQYLEAIYEERRHEFAFEMHRWYDLLRHPNPNYFIDVMRAAGKTNIQPKHRFMPIPQAERDKNSNLTQNEGY
jgi:hypothetical protein